MKRACVALFGSMLVALAALGASAPVATAVAPAGYSPGSPAGSEYREQLTTARQIGARDGGRPAGGSASEDGSSPAPRRHAAGSSLFGVGVTPRDDARNGRAGAGNSGAAAPAAATERSAIAAAARAPLDGPPASLITGLLVVAALLACGLFALLLRRQAAPRL